MKRISGYAFILVFSVFQCVSSQNNPQAEKLLTDLLNGAKTTAIRTNFKLISSNKKQSESQTTTGIFTLKGTKFMLDMPEMKVWFDGKTQWTYNQQNNEVSITEPTEKEIAETNPMAILTSFKSKCNIIFSSKNKSNQNYIIELIPKIKNQEIVKIDTQINKTSGNLFSIYIIYKNGNLSQFVLNNYQKEIKVAENLFVFNENRYLGVTVNDLR